MAARHEVSISGNGLYCYGVFSRCRREKEAERAIKGLDRFATIDQASGSHRVESTRFVPSFSLGGKRACFALCGPRRLPAQEAAGESFSHFSTHHSRFFTSHPLVTSLRLTFRITMADDDDTSGSATHVGVVATSANGPAQGTISTPGSESVAPHTNTHGTVSMPEPGSVAAHNNAHVQAHDNAQVTGAAEAEGAVDGEGDDEDSEDYDSDYDSEYDSDEDQDGISSFTRKLDAINCFGFESSYTFAQQVERAEYFEEAGSSLDYDFCTAKELRHFTLQRHLPDPYPAGLTLKYYYIRTLEKADREPSFRFMDLPPEMRALVYSDALHIPTECLCALCRTCDAQILRTCKQIHREAVDILYEQNPIACRFDAHSVSSWQAHRRTTIHRAEYSSTEFSPWEFPLTAFLRYPEFFRRVRHLEIAVIVHSCEGNTDDMSESSDASDYIGKCLLSLASFLMDKHTLKSLEITVSFPQCDNVTLIESMLYPLCRLRKVPDVRFKGDVPTGLAAKMVTMIQSSELVFNTIKHLQLLMAEAKAYQELLHLTQATEGMIWVGYCRAGSLSLDLQEAIDSVGIESTEAEKSIHRDMGKLRDAVGEFDHFDHAEIEESGSAETKDTLRDLTSARHARRTHNAECGWTDIPTTAPINSAQ